MPSEVRFTRAQRLDLVRISAAAVASTVFFTVPMFLVRPPNAPARVENRATPPRHLALAALSQPVTESQLPATSETAPSTPLDVNVVSVVTTTEVASVTTPALQGNAAARSRPAKPPQVRARASSPAATPSLSRRLARFFAGNGKYNVKPFPTVSTSGS
jgi:hypothetical protein